MNLSHGIARIDPVTGTVLDEWKTDQIGYDMAAGAEHRQAALALRPNPALQRWKGDLRLTYPPMLYQVPPGPIQLNPSPHTATVSPVELTAISP